MIFFTCFFFFDFSETGENFRCKWIWKLFRDRHDLRSQCMLSEIKCLEKINCRMWCCYENIADMKGKRRRKRRSWRRTPRNALIPTESRKRSVWRWRRPKKMNASGNSRWSMGWSNGEIRLNVQNTRRFKISFEIAYWLWGNLHRAKEKNDLAGLPFIIIHFEVFYEDTHEEVESVWFPAEVGAVKCTLRDGILSHFHSFIGLTGDMIPGGFLWVWFYSSASDETKFYSFCQAFVWKLSKCLVFGKFEGCLDSPWNHIFQLREILKFLLFWKDTLPVSAGKNHCFTIECEKLSKFFVEVHKNRSVEKKG